MAPHHASFDGVRGYATYERARKRGEEIAARVSDWNYRWVVIALPNGRFAPCVIYNEGLDIGAFIGISNVCSVN